MRKSETWLFLLGVEVLSFSRVYQRMMKPKPIKLKTLSITQLHNGK